MWLGSLVARLGPDFVGKATVAAFYADAKNEPDDSVIRHLACLRGLEQLDFCPPPADMFTFGEKRHSSVTDAGLVHLRDGCGFQG